MKKWLSVSQHDTAVIHFQIFSSSSYFVSEKLPAQFVRSQLLFFLLRSLYFELSTKNDEDKNWKAGRPTIMKHWSFTVSAKDIYPKP